MSEDLENFNKKNLVDTEKNRIFASDCESSALAVDIGKPIPTLRGKAACNFLKRARKAEEEAERRKNIPPTLKQLEKQLMYEEFFLEDDRRALREREKRIENLKNKIKDLKENNGKTEEE